MSHSILNDISRANPQLEYEVQQRIGGGTYGDVYKAKRIGTSSLAAIKIIKFEAGDDLSVILQEIVVMKELNHANIVAYYNAYMRQSRLWICMEYCSGGSLQDIYHAIGPLPEKNIAFVLREMLKGLAYLHHMGKMHRDVKGANILLTEDGEVKLADFGVSAQITTTLSKRKSFIGSPYWMSPEIAAVERKGGYNQQCDIWSLGITAVELAELQPPLFDLHPMRALYLLSKSSYKSPVLKDKKKWSEDYQSFVKMALTKNPKKRPTAILLETHPFVRQSNLSTALGRDLIDQARNPRRGVASDQESLNEQEGEEGGFHPPPQLKRIPSKRPSEDPNQPKSSPNLPSVLARFRNHLPGQNSPESVHLPTLGDSSDFDAHSSSSETLDHTLRRPLDKVSRPRSTPLLPSMTTPSIDQLELDDDFSATLRIGRFSDDSYNTEKNNPEKNQNQKSQIEKNEREKNQNQKTEWTEWTEWTERTERTERESSPHHPEPPPRTKHLRKKQSEQQENGTSVPTANGTSVPIANGLPRTQMVHMGACFSKIFNECPLHINATASWVHPVTRDQHILIASEEGLYTLNLNELHELAMDLLHSRRTVWLHVCQNVLMTVSGKTPHLFRHDLVALHAKGFNRFSQFSQSMNRIPEKFIPKKFVSSTKVAETKGCLRCSVGKNSLNGGRYLAAGMPLNVILMQWYEPMNKYMMLRQIDWHLPSPFNTFSILIKDMELPKIITGVRPLVGDADGIQFELVDFQTSLVTVTNPQTANPQVTNPQTANPQTANPQVTNPQTANPQGTSIPNAYLDVTSITQIDNWTVVICSGNVVEVVDTEGCFSNRSAIFLKKFHFNFEISALVCLSDSLIAFNKHGMEGRSFAKNEVTQDIVDESKIYKVLGTEKLTVLESKPKDGPLGPSNLYIVTGHENSF